MTDLPNNAFQTQGVGAVSAANLNAMVQRVSSVAFLRSLPGVAGVGIYLQGYVTPGDGGQGNFWWNSAATGADDGATVIVPNGVIPGHGAWLRLDFGEGILGIVTPQMFGARPGTASPTDCTAPIQAADNFASANGYELFFPGGFYGINASGVSRGGCNWGGAGSQVSIIQVMPIAYPANYAAISSNLTGKAHRTTNIGFSLSGGMFSASVASAMMEIINDDGWSVDNCRFTGIQEYTSAIAVDGGSYWTINHNYFNMPTPSSQFNQSINISVAAGPVNTCDVSFNVSIGTGFDSLGVFGRYAYNYVIGTKFGTCMGVADSGPPATLGQIFIGNVCGFTVGEDSNNTYPDGIQNWSNNSIIVGNTCFYCSGNGISNGGQVVTIANNVVYNNGQTVGQGAGIAMYAVPPGFSGPASLCTVSGNNVFDSQAIKTQTYSYGEFNSGQAMVFNIVKGNSFGPGATGVFFINSVETAHLDIDGLGPLTYAQLTTDLLASYVIPGNPQWCSNSNVATFGTQVTGTGSNAVPIHSDGSVWRVG